MKKFIKIIYPFLFVIVPICIYILFEENTMAIPLLSAYMLLFFSMFVYDNKVPVLLVLIVTFLYAGICLLFPLFYLYSVFGWSLVILLVCLILICIFLVLIMRPLVLNGKSFKSIILIRKILIICLVCVPVLLCGSVTLGMIMESNGLSINQHSVDKIFLAGMGLLFWIVMGVVELYRTTRRVYLFNNYYKPYYILFLRRFIKDDKPQVQKCLETLTCNASGLEIMKIGNPRTILSHSDYYDTVYLPSTDWQSYLQNYIKCAKIVFSIIDASEGVIWEMIKNEEYLDKYIYCIMDWDCVDDVKLRLYGHNFNKSDLNFRFVKILSYLQRRKIKDMILFVFENDRVIFTNNMKAIMDYKLASIWCYDLKVLSM